MATSSERGGRYLAVIPARGGSKRLPRKNAADFRGKPIIAYTIAAARDAAIFNRVLVSTEDAEIAAIAKHFGAEADMRPASLASDQATVAEVCLELLDRLERSGERYETITALYATSPLRTAADIRATLSLLSPGACDFAMSVSEFQQQVHQALTQSADGALKPLFPESAGKRASGDFCTVASNGSVCAAAVDAFRKQKSFYGKQMRGYIMPRERSVDIDTADDLALAEFYASRSLK